METRYYFSKRIRISVVREVFDNGTVFLHLYEMNGAKYPGASALIGSYGGVEGFWASCISKERFDERCASWIQANSPERVAERKEKAAARRLAIEEARGIAYRELVAKGLPVLSTYENICIVLRFLNTKNWGGWELPQMTIGYRCNQYDCDGKQASTMILDEPIEVYGEKVSHFVTGAPLGHLMKYHRC